MADRRGGSGKVMEEVVLLVGALAIGIHGFLEWVDRRGDREEHSKTLAVAATLAREKLSDLRFAENVLANNAGGELPAGMVIRSGVEYARSWSVADGSRDLPGFMGKKVTITLSWMDEAEKQHVFTLSGLIDPENGKSLVRKNGVGKSRVAFSTSAILSSRFVEHVPEWLTIHGTVGGKSPDGVVLLVSGDGVCRIAGKPLLSYTCRVPRHFSGSIIPFKPGVTFFPGEQAPVNLTRDKLRQNFEAG